MKKNNVVFLLKAALILAVCFLAVACNQDRLLGNNEFADVTISIGALHGENQHARSVGENGLPVLTDENAQITITAVYNGTGITDHTKTLALKKIAVGTEIDISVAVKTDYASWSGTKKHTVIAGNNTIDIQLSKTAKSAAKFLMSVGENSPTTIKLGEREVFKKTIRGTPLTARDSLGRLYLMYTAGASKKSYLTRFTVEGEEDTDFKDLVTPLLPSDAREATQLTVDSKNEHIFFDVIDDMYCLKKNGNTFTLVKAAAHPSVANEFLAMTAFDEKLFIIENKIFNCKLKVYKIEITDTAGIDTLTFTPLPGEQILTADINNFTGKPQFKGTLFADTEGIYCLLSSQDTSATTHSVGKLFHYTYDGSSFTLKNGADKAGLNPNGMANAGLPYHATYFSYPIAFIGFDSENIYIADDGVDIQEKNENYRIIGNKNRIAAYNRKNGTLSFSDTNVSWYKDAPEYRDINTPILLWKKETHGMTYWAGTTGTEDCPPGNSDAIVARGGIKESKIEKPTDIFCYDQDGNVYIVRKIDGDDMISFYTLNVDTNRWTDRQNKLIGPPANSLFIAADISYKTKYVYVMQDSVIKRYKWTGDFEHADEDAEFGTLQIPQLSSPYSRKITALTVNKDGIFVAVRDERKDAMGNPEKYQLKVLKYDKNKHPQGECIVGQEKEIKTTEGSTTITHKEKIEALQIRDGVLYAITADIYEKKENAPPHTFCGALMNGDLYRITGIAGTLPAEAELADVKLANESSHTGYGFTRFNAIKPNKLIIASNAGYKGNGFEGSTNKVITYDVPSFLSTEVPTDVNHFSNHFTTEGWGSN